MGVKQSDAYPPFLREEKPQNNSLQTPLQIRRGALIWRGLLCRFRELFQSDAVHKARVVEMQIVKLRIDANDGRSGAIDPNESIDDTGIISL